jgi:hypothetical protein
MGCVAPPGGPEERSVVSLDRFSPPGNLTDLDGPLAAAWSDFISDRLDNEVVALVSRSPGLQPQFYNPAKLDVTGSPVPISWPAFPNIVEINFGDDPQRMFEEAERRDNQDEYLEWAAVRESGKITRVTYTCEGPEYWNFLARADPDLLVSLYGQLVGHAVPRRDLLTRGGTYIPRNRWNRQHAVHLVQPNNTLSAEINIASQATILRRHGGHDPVTDSTELIECSGFGVKERHSDPHIGDVVNQQARAGCSVTLEDPIALYLEALPDPADLGVRKPDGTAAGKNYWRLERGDPDHILRAVFEVPAGETVNGAPFTVGDMTVEGDPIEFGGQIVKGGVGLRVKLTGVIGKSGVFRNPSFPCPGQPFSALGPGPASRQA